MPRTETDILLKDWANSGLRVPSTVRLSRLDCLEKNLLLAKLGKTRALPGLVGKMYSKIHSS
ncbi:hypothetical protein BH695_4395 [Microcystis aeruginosa PCC 7806SL]|uniref:Uncharacterized protein n=1 Tax=Microcystis aeruginosa PCC 7806SL TaxID=1903187 RepID=A0AB33BV66_MICA7|nr:hypothetical protein BH695_4395 [Microcystis aeruginosa PCC 7806SL]